MKNGSVMVFGILCIYIALLVGMTIESIGDIPECKPYTWRLPFNMFIFLITPAILGVLIGLDHDWGAES